ncbi:hypothetical protein HMPREF0239_04418 [Clostridium sp. ATCC BAA-442]|jgi:hypothetical protein|nr:hypothetical protein HMPREF0239_04418 [Clostridium sp. ATCC BAA-442]
MTNKRINIYNLNKIEWLKSGKRQNNVSMVAIGRCSWYHAKHLAGSEL